MKWMNRVNRYKIDFPFHSICRAYCVDVSMSAHAYRVCRIDAQTANKNISQMSIRLNLRCDENKRVINSNDSEWERNIPHTWWQRCDTESKRTTTTTRLSNVCRSFYLQFFFYEWMTEHSRQTDDTIFRFVHFLSSFIFCVVAVAVFNEILSLWFIYARMHLFPTYAQVQLAN